MSASPQEGISCREGVVYCAHDGQSLAGDLYLPAGDGPFPCLVALPGGGWRMCARGNLGEWGSYLARRGWGVFAIDYRVATARRKAFPEAAQDAAAAVRYIRGSAATLGIDPQRIGLLGASAGAHLASLVALAHDRPVLSNAYPEDTFAGVSAQVKSLVSIYGIFDMQRQWQDDLSLNPGVEGNLVRNLLGKDPYEDPHIYFEASPLRHITYDKNRMPVFVSWGTADEWVNPEQSESFVRALQQGRFNVRTHRMPGASHFWFNQPLTDPSSHSSSLAPHLLRFLAMSL